MENNDTEKDGYKTGYCDGYNEGIKKLKSLNDKSIIDKIGEFFVVFEDNSTNIKYFKKLNITELLILNFNIFNNFKILGFFKNENETLEFIEKNKG